MNDRELATILAGLRCWQAYGTGPHIDLADIASNGGTLDPPSEVEIDDLCERLNLCQPSEGICFTALTSLVAASRSHSDDMQRQCRGANGDDYCVLNDHVEDAARIAEAAKPDPILLLRAAFAAGLTQADMLTGAHAHFENSAP